MLSQLGGAAISHALPGRKPPKYRNIGDPRLARSAPQAMLPELLVHGTRLIHLPSTATPTCLQQRQRAHQLLLLGGAVLPQQRQLAAQRDAKVWAQLAVQKKPGKGWAAASADRAGVSVRRIGGTHPSCLRSMACRVAESMWRLAGLGPTLPGSAWAPLLPPSRAARSCAPSASFCCCSRSARACSSRLASCRASTSRRAEPAVAQGNGVQG